MDGQERRNGVRIRAECVSNERFATSANGPGSLYRLTAYSCTCKGYVQTGRCQHHSLFPSDLSSPHNGHTFMFGCAGDNYPCLSPFSTVPPWTP